MSGGVDSSVTAALLKDAGYDVTGVFIKTWHPDWLTCTWKDERRDAMRVAAALDIPFLTCDATEEYKQGVVDVMISEYKAGRTPNPDVLCNREVKFGAFLKLARAHGADAIATGHYAQVKTETDGTFSLLKSVDEEKEQSYFLYKVTQNDLRSTLLPIGGMQKSEVRRLAKKFNLPTAEKKDSQGLCFIGKVDFKEFLAHYITGQKGDVLDEAGNVIGEHDGAVFLTIGERHGFRITQKTPDDSRMYVVSKNIENNTVTVSTTPPKETDTFSKIHLDTVNWIREIPERYKKYSCQIRYHGEFLPCTIDTKNQIVSLENPRSDLSLGQSVVVYDGMECVGGGTISAVR